MLAGRSRSRWVSSLPCASALRRVRAARQLAVAVWRFAWIRGSRSMGRPEPDGLLGVRQGSAHQLGRASGRGAASHEAACREREFGRLDALFDHCQGGGANGRIEAGLGLDLGGQLGV